MKEVNYTEIVKEIEKLKNKSNLHFERLLLYPEDMSVSSDVYSVSFVAESDGYVTITSNVSGTGTLKYFLNDIPFAEVTLSGDKQTDERLFVSAGENVLKLDASSVSGFSVGVVDVCGNVSYGASKSKIFAAAATGGAYLGVYDGVKGKCEVRYRSPYDDALIYTRSCDDFAMSKLSDGNIILALLSANSTRFVLINVSFQDVVGEVNVPMVGALAVGGAYGGKTYVIGSDKSVTRYVLDGNLGYTSSAIGARAKKVIGAPDCQKVVFVGLDDKAVLVTE